MLEKLKKPSVLWIITAVCALVIFAFTDLYYHYYALHSIVLQALFVVLNVLIFALLFCVANNTHKEYSVKRAVIFTVPFAVVYFFVLFLITLYVNESNRMYFYWAQVFVYVAFALNVIGFALYFIQLAPVLRFKNTAIACAIVLAVSVTAVSCWGSLERSVADSTTTYKWELDAPEYTDGILSRKYNCGVMKGDQYHDGKNGGPNEETNFMQVAYKTDRTAFNNYCKKVLAGGYTLDSDSEIENIVSRTFVKDGKLLHVYYNAVEKSVRVITDPVSDAPGAVSYTYNVKDDAADNYTKIYQYALMYDDDCDDDYDYGGGIERCGMNYVIRLADNSLIVIDGGDICQASDEAVKGFYDLCKEITGEDQLTIACWICTHAHGDHISFFGKFLRVYGEQGLVTLERFMFNFPNWKEVPGGNEDAWYALFRRMEKYAPDAKQIKPHTGETFQFANAKIEILYTQEDAFNYHTNKTNINDFNDTSVTYRFTFNDKTTFMVVGDMSRCAQFMVNQNYTAKTLKSDIVQAAHHGYNELDILYPIFAPEYVFYPQGVDNAKGENGTATYNYNVLKGLTKEDNIFLVNRYTYGLFIDKDGNITKDPTERPYVGPEFWNGIYFDGSAN